MRIIVCDAVQSPAPVADGTSVCLYQDRQDDWIITIVETEGGEITCQESISVLDSSPSVGVRRAFLSLQEKGVESLILKTGRMPFVEICRIIQDGIGNDFEVEMPKSPPPFPINLV
jgi:hypothetical protein